MSGQEAFEQAIAVVRTMLGIDEGEDEPVAAPWQISIDEFAVRFEQTDDERSLKTTLVVGSLSADPAHRQGQLRRILKHSLAMLRDHRYVAVVEEAEDRRLLLQLQFATPYAELRPQLLAGQLSELVSIGEIYGEMLGGAVRRAAAPPLAEETLIFRP